MAGVYDRIKVYKNAEAGWVTPKCIKSYVKKADGTYAWQDHGRHDGVRQKQIYAVDNSGVGHGVLKQRYTWNTLKEAYTRGVGTLNKGKYPYGNFCYYARHDASGPEGGNAATQPCELQCMIRHTQAVDSELYLATDVDGNGNHLFTMGLQVVWLANGKIRVTSKCNKQPPYEWTMTTDNAVEVGKWAKLIIKLPVTKNNTDADTVITFDGKDTKGHLNGYLSTNMRAYLGSSTVDFKGLAFLDMYNYRPDDKLLKWVIDFSTAQSVGDVWESTTNVKLHKDYDTHVEYWD